MQGGCLIWLVHVVWPIGQGDNAAAQFEFQLAGSGGVFAGTWSLARPLLPLARSAIGPPASKTQAKTNSLPAPLLFCHLKNQKKGGSAACWPCRAGCAVLDLLERRCHGGEGGRPGRAAFAAGRGSLRSTSSQPTQWNGSHLRSRPHATTNVVCSSLPRPARHEALHASRLSTAVVHLICNQGVTGSNPVAGTNEIKYLCQLRVPQKSTCGTSAEPTLRDFCHSPIDQGRAVPARA